MKNVASIALCQILLLISRLERFVRDTFCIFSSEQSMSKLVLTDTNPFCCEQIKLSKIVQRAFLQKWNATLLVIFLSFFLSFSVCLFVSFFVYFFLSFFFCLFPYLFDSLKFIYFSCPFFCLFMFCSFFLYVRTFSLFFSDNLLPLLYLSPSIPRLVTLYKLTIYLRQLLGQMQKKYLFGMAAMPLPLSCANCIDDNNLSLCLYPVGYMLIKVLKPQLGVC